MNHYEAARLKAVTQHQESFFIVRMIGIVNQAGALVQKNRLSFLERDAMLGNVGSGFTRIPGKLNIARSIILAISPSL
jgi:hypothetical protein